MALRSLSPVTVRLWVNPGDVDKREFIAFWLAGGRVLAGMNVNIWGVTDEIQALVRGGRPVDTGRLADPDVPLDQVTV